MAPLSYYWIISFIYLVITKAKEPQKNLILICGSYIYLEKIMTG
jgi:hypothetical protein